MSKKLVNLDFLDREAQLYRNSKDSIKQNSQDIRKIVEENTKREVEEVQQAIKNLNEKMEKIMESEVVKNKQQQIKLSQEQVAKSIDLASDTFFKVRKVIRDKQNLTDQQKREYEKKLYDKIIDKFMTQEEKEMFEQLMRGGTIMIMGNPYNLGGMGIGGLSGVPMIGGGEGVNDIL